ncbi:MAG TPA: 30S ribosomal protein S9 [Candidatus Nanoarchaeia archaeon]|nr:30S ribosomal protein S9 [Candidatus Nanoarchaeia archaeon]
MAETKTERYTYGLGRRKAAIATVRLYSGKGEVSVNDMTAQEYFNNDTLLSIIASPLVLAGRDSKYRVSLKVSGGGKAGQADACRLAISRALNDLDEALRPTLKKAGMLTRDSREKERKKPGLKKARKAPQFSKR